MCQSSRTKTAQCCEFTLMFPCKPKVIDNGVQRDCVHFEAAIVFACAFEFFVLCLQDI